MGHRRKSRLAGILALAVAAVLLSGCSLIGDGGTVIGFLGEDAANADRMRTLAADVAKLDGVNEVDGSFDATSAKPGPALFVTADAGATTDQLAAVIARAAVDYSESWSAFLGTVQVTATEGSVLTVTDFSRDESQVTAEIAYWRAVEQVAGSPLSLELSSPGIDFSGSVISAAQTDLEAARSLQRNFDELRELGPAPTDTGILLTPGFFVRGILPDPTYVDVARELATLAPSTDPTVAGATGSTFRWAAIAGTPPGANYILAVDDLEFSADGTGSAGWKIVTAAATAVATAGLDRVTFSFLQGDESRAFHLGDCADEPVPGAVPDTASAEVLLALEAAGVALPSDTAPGFCQLWNGS